MVAAVTLLLATAAGAAEMTIEVLPVRWGEPAALAATLKPLVPAPGSVSVFRDKLVVKTSPANLEEIKQILASLDRPPRNLVVTVRFARAGEADRVEHEVSGTIGSRSGRISSGRAGGSGPGLTLGGGGEGGSGSARVLTTHSRLNENNTQRLRVLEGREAFIRTGESVPLAQRRLIIGRFGAGVLDSITYRDVDTGFRLRARVNGPRVLLDITPVRSRVSPRGGGVIETQRAWTSLSGALGRWIEIGGAVEHRDRSGAGISRGTRVRGETDRRIFVRVDLAAD